MTESDIVIIGGGPGGYVAAIHAAHMGARVSLIEKDKLGGICLNRGCIPTKALVRSAEVFTYARRAGDYGIEVQGAKADLSRIMAHKRKVVEKLVGGVEQLMKANRISVHLGTGRIVSPHMVRVDDTEIATRKVVIATGSESSLLPIDGLDLPGVLTTDDILELEKLPESLIVVGGSHVGVEFASIFSALGTKTTIVKRRPLLLEPIDEEVGRRFAQTLSRQGIEVIIGAAVNCIRQTDRGVSVCWDTSEGERAVDGKMVLMATGRRPYTQDVGLSDIGIDTHSGAVKVNEYLETNVEGIYAIGDVLGRHMVAHVASYEGEVAVENALGCRRKADYRAVPTCVYTFPPVAGVGISEKEAKEGSIPHTVSKFPFAACGRAVAMDDTAGLVKMICHAHDGKVLGLHIMGPHADDLIAEGALAVQLGATARDIAHTIHAHPTLPEAVHETALGQLEGSIHFGRAQ